MRLAYAVDHINRKIYYHPDFFGILPNINYKKIKVTTANITSSISKRRPKSELLLSVSNVDTLLLHSNIWLGTHPNGLLIQPGIAFATSNASMGFIYKKFGVTAWHNVMIAPHINGETPNVPMVSLFDNRQWRVSILTRPAIFVGKDINDVMLELDYDVAILENQHKYPYEYASVLGKEVCAYGVISATLPMEDKVVTLASYLPSIVNVESGCPNLKTGMEVTLASAYSGIRKGIVTSSNTEIVYFIEPKFLVIVEKGFRVDAPSVPGDSGGAVFIE